MLVNSQKGVYLGHHWTQELNGGIWGLLNLWGMPRSGSSFLVLGAAAGADWGFLPPSLGNWTMSFPVPPELY